MTSPSAAAFDPTNVAQVRGEAQAALSERAAGVGSGAGDLNALYNGLGASAANDLHATLMQALGAGANPTTLAGEYGPIWAATGASATRAATIARTEMLGSYRAAALANYRANRDVVTGWTWTAEQGPFTCGACLAMDGSVHGLDEDMDGMHPNCRCSAVPITASYADLLGPLGIDASAIPETSFSRESGASWLARQSNAVQDAVLGKAAGSLYRAGKVSLEDFVGYDEATMRLVPRSLKDMGYHWRDVLRGTAPSMPPTPKGAPQSAPPSPPTTDKATRTTGEAERTYQAMRDDAATFSSWMRDLDPEGYDEDEWAAEHAASLHATADRLSGNEEFTKVADALGFHAGETYGPPEHPWTPEMAAIDDLRETWTSGIGERSDAPLAALRKGIADAFGFDVPLSTLDEAHLAEAEALYAVSPEGWQALARAVHEQSMAWFEDRGITEVTVYRGRSWTESRPPANPAEFDGRAVSVDVPLRGATSWTVDPAWAFNFAGRGDYSMLIADRVPVDAIWASPFAGGFGNPGEAEMVLMGDERQMAAYEWPHEGKYADVLTVAESYGFTLKPADQEQLDGIMHTLAEQPELQATAVAQSPEAPDVAPLSATGRDGPKASDATRKKLTLRGQADAWTPLPGAAERAPLRLGTSETLDFAARTPEAARQPDVGQPDRIASGLLAERSASDPAPFGRTPRAWEATPADVADINLATPGADIAHFALTDDQRASLEKGYLISGRNGAGYDGLGGPGAISLTKGLAGEGATLTSAVLRDDARGISASDLRAIQRPLVRDLYDQLDEAQANLRAGDASEQERIDRINALLSVANDNGRLAITQGYDYVTSDAGNGRIGYQVVNPGALRLLPSDITLPEMQADRAPLYRLQREARASLATQADTLATRYGWESAATTTDAAQALAEHLAGIEVAPGKTRFAPTGGSVPTKVEFNPDMPPEIANQIAAVYSRLAETFPDAAANMRWLGGEETPGGKEPSRYPIEDPAMAHVGGTIAGAPPPDGEAPGFDLKINDRHLIEPGTGAVRYGANVAVNGEMGWLVNGTRDMGSNITHEFGHVVHFHLLYGSTDPALRHLGQAWIDHYSTQDAIDEAGTLSSYAGENAMEAFAESFAALYNGDTSNEDHPTVQAMRALLSAAFGPDVLPARDGTLPDGQAPKPKRAKGGTKNAATTATEKHTEEKAGPAWDQWK